MSIRGVFAGSGMDAMSSAEIRDAVYALAPAHRPLRLVYLGTASYDLPAPATAQTAAFVAESTVAAVNVAMVDPTPEDFQKINACDVIVVSGGNTQYALRRWRETGLDKHLWAAAHRGCVLVGGSAGAICWFDGGHSDSADPATFAATMVGGVEASNASSWEYVRVGGLSLFPGLLCPHFDRTQSNGVPRSEDFKKMLQRHAGERGVGIDHWAALVVDGPAFRVVSVDGRRGSAPDGRPTVVAMDVVEGHVVASELPREGNLRDALRPATNPPGIVPDPRAEELTVRNPTYRTPS